MPIPEETVMSIRKKKIDVLLGADHAGFDLKAQLGRYLSERGFAWADAGTFGPEAVDYPDLAFQVAEAVKAGRAKRGILICGTGVGMAMAANRIPGIRAALCNEVFTAKMARAHNDANILTLGSRVVGIGLAKMIVDTFLETPFERGRHLRRIRKLENRS